MDKLSDGGGEAENLSGFNRYACVCAIVACMISIIYGYDTGVMSGAVIFIKEDHKTNDTQVEILTGILNICALAGALTAGRTSDNISRGQCIAGIGVGFTLMVAPVYSAEISSAMHRGFLTSLPDLGISLGVLLGYVSNYFFAKLILKLGWRMMLGVAAIPSLALAFRILKIPESPMLLVLQGRPAKAKRVLILVCNSEQEVESRFQDIIIAAGIDKNYKEDVVELPRKTRGEGVWKELLLRPSPSVRWILLARGRDSFLRAHNGDVSSHPLQPTDFQESRSDQQ
ncbi:hypothetical protein NL676_023097 [Syzygium grande]|nr:hypothetical protein NL676_023097 [Syzygium grande]